MAKKRGDVGIIRRKDKSKDANKSTSEQVHREPEEPKTRLTVYVEAPIGDRLDSLRLELKKMTGKKGYALSKSHITEVALRMALKDFDAHGEDSYLANAVRLHVNK